MAQPKELKKMSAQELNALGNEYADCGGVSEAESCYQRSLALRREAGDLRGEGLVLNNLGALYHQQGQYREALDYYQKSLALAQEAGEKESELASYLNQALVCFALQEAEPFLRTVAAAEALAQELGMWEPMARMRWLRGRQALFSPQGYEKAMGYFGQALIYAQCHNSQTLEDVAFQVGKEIRRLAQRGEEGWALVFCDYLLQLQRKQSIGKQVATVLIRLREEMLNQPMLAGRGH